MFKKKDFIIFTVIIILFAIGLVGFYIFSAPYGDGLEKTMENAEVEESESVYNAPLDYGEDYQSTFFIGLIGFAVTLFGVYIFSWLLRKSNAPQQR